MDEISSKSETPLISSFSFDIVIFSKSVLVYSEDDNLTEQMKFPWESSLMLAVTSSCKIHEEFFGLNPRLFLGSFSDLIDNLYCMILTLL